jgi:hypothetical protein
VRGILAVVCLDLAVGAAALAGPAGQSRRSPLRRCARSSRAVRATS